MWHRSTSSVAQREKEREREREIHGNMQLFECTERSSDCGFKDRPKGRHERATLSISGMPLLGSPDEHLAFVLFFYTLAGRFLVSVNAREVRDRRVADEIRVFQARQRGLSRTDFFFPTREDFGRKFLRRH